MIERLKKYEGIDMDKEKHPSNPNFTVRDTIKLADEVAELTSQRDELLAALKNIKDMEGSERDEWDAVERLIPEIAYIARSAIASVKGGSTTNLLRISSLLVDGAKGGAA